MDLANSTTVPVNFFNPHSYLVGVREDSVVGQLETVDEVSTIIRYKNLNEKSNLSAPRWVLLQEKSVLPSKCSRVTKGQENSFAQNIQEPMAPLLEHLTELYKCNAEDNAKYEKVIYWLLLKHQNVFPKNENGLDHTHLVQQTIDTGNAKHIKQPP